MATEVIKCNCQHEFQDKEYGKGMRVHNEGTKSGPSESSWTCTVCGNTIRSGNSKKKK